MEGWDSHPAQWAQLISNPKNMHFGPEDMFFAQWPPNNKTVVANKAYSLPSGVFRLMTLKTCCVHTKKQSFMERWLFKMKDPYCTEAWKYFSKVLWQCWLDHIGTRKLPCPTWGRNWWGKHDVYSRKTKKIFSPSPLFLWLWKCNPLSTQGSDSLPRNLTTLQVNQL